MLKSNDQKVPKQAEAKGEGVMNPRNYNFNYCERRKILMLSKRYDSTKSTVELGYMCPRGLTGPAAVTLTKYSS